MTTSIKFIGISLLLILVACKDEKKQKEVISLLNTEAFQEHIEGKEDIQLVDVRTAEEVADGFIPGAVNICYTCPEFESEIEALDKTKPVYVYCRRGSRSANASAVMKRLGFSRVYDLKGGYTAWTEAGLETTSP